MTKIVQLKKKEDRRILNGHLWAFSNEIEEIKGEPQIGDIVELLNHSGTFLGLGFFNPHSLISVRLLTRQQELIDFNFFYRRIESAYKLRQKIYPESNVYRLVHGEADFLPGLIIDRYNDYFSVQTFSAGMDKYLSLICDILRAIFNPLGIIERNEAPIRTLEGLPQKKGILWGALQQVTVSDGLISYNVDLLEGQKTGLFLDQRENRITLRKYSNNAKVLDCFCNDGGFALHTAQAGAKSVLGIDISETAIQRATHNAQINSLNSNIKFQVADAFEFLQNAVNENQRYDLIILDPPSFAKSKRTVRKAKRGYRDIHCSAFRLLNSGGILATASCSHHITEETFITIINDCAKLVGRTIKILEWHGASPDHPTLPTMPETKYLKFGIFQVE